MPECAKTHLQQSSNSKNFPGEKRRVSTPTSTSTFAVSVTVETKKRYVHPFPRRRQRRRSPLPSTSRPKNVTSVCFHVDVNVDVRRSTFAVTAAHEYLTAPHEYLTVAHEYLTAPHEYLTSTSSSCKRRGNGCYLQAGERAASF